MLKRILAIAVMAFGLATLALAQSPTPNVTAAPQVPDVNQQVQGAGMIDWTDQVVRSTGVGALNPKFPQSAQRKNALRAAQLDAMRNIVETIQGVVLTSETTVENAMTSSDVIKTRVEGVIKNFRYVSKPRYMSDGSVEIDLEIPLNGKVGDVLYPDAMGQKKPSFSSLPTNFNYSEPQPWTGLIVDASEVSGVEPAMVPNILDESGEGVYGQDFVPRESAVNYGVAQYAKTLDDAKKLTDRIGTNPLVVRAIRTSGLNKCDLVISDKDVETVATISDDTDVYEKCKVVIVITTKQ